MAKGKGKGVDVRKVQRRRKAAVEARAEAAAAAPTPTPAHGATIVLDAGKECQLALIAELERIKVDVTAAEFTQDQLHDRLKAQGAKLTANFISTQEKMAEWKVRANVEADDNIISLKSEQSHVAQDVKRLRLEWEITMQKIHLVSRLHNRELTEMNLTGGK
jgi:hypothetical protein